MQLKLNFSVYIYIRIEKGVEDLDDIELIGLYWDRREKAIVETDKKYITNAPEDFPGEEYIKKVELVYEEKYEENLMPYYQFYVELENMKQENGLKTYGIYYVPAVDSKYIDNIDILDAKFN